MQPQKDNRAPNLTQQHPCKTGDLLDFNCGRVFSVCLFFILTKNIYNIHTGGSRLMRILLVRISLLLPKTFALCDFCVFLANANLGLMRFYVIFISLLWSIRLMQFLANATFSRSQKSH